MRIILTILLVVCLLSLKAQDIHYSQFNSAPVNLNPALTGSFDGDYRLVMNHRNQWQSVTVPFRTFSAGMDTRITSLPLTKSFIGAGLLFNTDQAGDSDFGTQQIKLSLSYHRVLKDDSSMMISAGLSGAYNNHSINYANLYFGSQYNGHQYDPYLPNQEVFLEDRISYFDFETGISFYYVINDIKWRSGLSFNHLNRPFYSFSEDYDVQLYRKFNLFSQADIYMNERMSLLPSVLYLRQGWFQELMLGGLFKFKLNNKKQ